MDTRGLPDLTPKQYGFVCGVLAGMTGADAVRGATDTSAWGSNTIWVEACKLKDHPKVRLWLNRAKAAAGKKAERTAEAHMNRLQELQDMALKGKNFGAAMRGEELIGRVSGHYVDRVRNETPDPVRDAQSALLSHVDKISPDAGRLLREALLQAPQKAASGQ